MTLLIVELVVLLVPVVREDLVVLRLVPSGDMALESRRQPIESKPCSMETQAYRFHLVTFALLGPGDLKVDGRFCLGWHIELCDDRLG